MESGMGSTCDLEVRQLVVSFCSLIQTRLTWEESTLIKKFFPVGLSMRSFLDYD